MGDLLEEILVLPRKALFGSNDEYAFRGFRNLDEWDENRFFSTLNRKGHFLYRFKMDEYQKLDAEHDDRFKQIIPVGIFCHQDQFFVYTRLPKSSEARLHGRSDLGIAGHLNPEDVGESLHGKEYEVTTNFANRDRDTLEYGLCREFHEEVHYEDPYGIEPVGFVNLDDTLVDKVHFGVVYLIHGHTPHISVRETEQMRGNLYTLEEMKEQEIPFKGWQIHLFEYLQKREG